MAGMDAEGALGAELAFRRESRIAMDAEPKKCTRCRGTGSIQVAQGREGVIRCPSCGGTGSKPEVKVKDSKPSFDAFKTNPGKIASEHEKEVQNLFTEAAKNTTKLKAKDCTKGMDEEK